MSIYNLGSLKGVSERRVSFQPGLLSPDVVDSLPAYFPQDLWTQQATRYAEYWDWFTGEVLEEQVATTPEGHPVHKFPLGINPVRNFARKHAALLWGEAQDGPDPYVKAKITAKKLFSTNNPKPEDVELGKTLSELVNAVWSQSNGRSIMQEAGVLAQFLGGYVLQLVYEPWNPELVIPLRVKGIIPDFFLPIWKDDDYYNLLEAFLIYRIPMAAARLEYGDLIDATDTAPYAIYVEHWRRDKLTITINGKPLETSYTMPDGTVIKISYDNAENVFGFVPFVYIPHVREGNFFGSSIVDDMKGLVKELNKAMADEGDMIAGAVRRRRYLTNQIGPVKEVQLAPGVRATHLGQTPPTSKHEPNVIFEDPPTLTAGLVDYPDRLWEALIREGQLSDVFFGKDEGSQRSALTLAFRMLPSTTHARAERTFWNDGLNTMAKMILLISMKHIAIRAVLKQYGVAVPKDFLRRFDFAQDWLPMVPRDREAIVNEIILRKQTDLISPELALELFGDVLNIPEEIKRIKEWLEFLQQLAAKYAVQPGQPGTGSGSQEGDTAATDVQTPIASTNLNE